MQRRGAPTTLPVDIPFDYSLAVLRGDDVILSIGNTRLVRPLASVTKVCAAWATLIGVDRSMLRLDDSAGPPGSTIRHLLAHASGLPADSREPLFAPGKRRVYSNAGFDVLGDAVEQATGTPIGRWIDETLFEPLGMSSALVPASPAHSGEASIEDLIVLANELLHPALLTPGLAVEAATIQFPELAGVVPGYGRHTPCPWGLGVEVKGGKSPHWTGVGADPATFGHFGVSGSFIWVDRVNNAAAVFLGAEPFGPWHKENWSPLNDYLLALARS